MKSFSIIVAIGLLLTGCTCGPARWADDATTRLKCGMSVDQARSAIGKDVAAMDVPREWTTHIVREGDTDLWLGFQDGKLRWIQILWATGTKEMAMHQRQDLCGSVPD